MSTETKPRLRLFVPDDLAPDAAISLSSDQCHYLMHVMRAHNGEAVWVFNGRDGQWLAHVTTLGKKAVIVTVHSLSRPQQAEPDLWLLAAPIKRDRIDLVAEKATELGVSALWPVLTQHTSAGRINTDRLEAHLREAAEQCERLTLPQLFAPAPLSQALTDWDPARPLIYLDESGGQPLLSCLADIPPTVPLAVLIGPEGGFSTHERAWLRSLPMVRPVSLGPRILRAETAAFAALAVIQAVRQA